MTFFEGTEGATFHAPVQMNADQSEGYMEASYTAPVPRPSRRHGRSRQSRRHCHQENNAACQMEPSSCFAAPSPTPSDQTTPSPMSATAQLPITPPPGSPQYFVYPTGAASVTSSVSSLSEMQHQQATSYLPTSSNLPQSPGYVTAEGYLAVPLYYHVPVASSNSSASSVMLVPMAQAVPSSIAPPYYTLPSPHAQSVPAMQGSAYACGVHAAPFVGASTPILVGHPLPPDGAMAPATPGHGATKKMSRVSKLLTKMHLKKPSVP